MTEDGYDSRKSGAHASRICFIALSYHPEKRNGCNDSYVGKEQAARSAAVTTSSGERKKPSRVYVCERYLRLDQRLTNY